MHKRSIQAFQLKKYELKANFSSIHYFCTFSLFFLITFYSLEIFTSATFDCKKKKKIPAQTSRDFSDGAAILYRNLFVDNNKPQMVNVLRLTQINMTKCTRELLISIAEQLTRRS